MSLWNLLSSAPIPGAHYRWYSTPQAAAVTRAGLLSTIQRHR